MPIQIIDIAAPHWEDEYMLIDSTQWEGEVNAENIEQVREALGKRMKTRYIAVDKFDLFTKDDPAEGDYVIFTPTNVTLRLVYGHEAKEYKTVVF